MKQPTKIGLLWGIGLMVLTVILVQFLTYHQVIELFAMAMVLIGSVYLGFGFKEKRIRFRNIEIASAVFFVIFALFGLWMSPWFIVAGLLLHGFWDLLHHQESNMTKIPEWYIPLCIIYDWAAAGYLTYFIITN
jgi:chromate transport protein ChrA